MKAAAQLEAYFKRIRFGGRAEAGLETLRELHLRHPQAIPFENITTLMHQPVPIDSLSVQAKLVGARRGGYCFEHNRLFSDMLRLLGFEVGELAARVVWQRAGQAPIARTHMVLTVRLGGEVYLCDVGFGGLTLTAPLLFAPALEQVTPHEPFRILQDGSDYELQAEIGGAWQPVYRFDLQPQLPIDFELANHYVATHPSSWFRSRLVVAKPTASGRLVLDNRQLTEYRTKAAADRRELRDGDELKSVLTESFGICLPREAGFDAAIAGLFQAAADQVILQ